MSLISPVYVSEVGMWAETGQRALVREVPPAQVAEAVVRAIRRDRSEVTVASLPLRIATRVPMAFPEVIHTRLGRAAGEYPQPAAEIQKAKR